MMRKVDKIIDYAIHTVPYYMEYGAVDISMLPIISKSDYLANNASLKNKNMQIDDLVSEFTSGSTGEPFRCYKSKYDRLFIASSLTKIRKDRYDAFDVRDKILRFYGSWTPYNYENNAILISVFYFNEVYAKFFCDKIIEYAPAWIFGTPSSILSFIDLLKKHGLEKYFLSATSINYVETTGEILSIDMKRQIASFFGCTVVNHYGCREIWHIALSCEANHMHIAEDNAHVEIVDKDYKNILNEDYGEIVVTGLNCRDVPFIRYRTGDIGRIIADPCKCGRSSPILDLPGGRKAEFIYLLDGNKISSVIIHHIFRKINSMGYAGIKQYSATQHSDLRLEIAIDTEETNCMKLNDIILSLFEEIIEDKLIIVVNYSSAIAIDTNGKHKTFISKVILADCESNGKNGEGKH